MKKAVKIIPIIFILIFNFFLVYMPHLNYQYPLHIDEYQHIKKALELKNNNYDFKTSYEPGFDFFLAGLFYTGFNPILHYKYLPAIIAVITSIILFLFVKRLTNNYHISLLSMVFFASLKSNINILGPFFFTPLTLALPFMLLFFLFFIEGLENNNRKQLITSSLIFLLLTLIHPPTALFTLLVITIYSIIKYKKVKENIKNLPYLIIALIISIMVFIQLIWKNSLIETLNFLKYSLIFKYGWTPVEIKYPILTFYRIIPSILALIGVYFAIKNKKLHILVIWAVIGLLSIISFSYLKVSILAPYQRVIYYTLLALIPLSAIGLYNIIILLKRKLEKYKFYIVTIILLLIVIFFTFKNQYETPTKAKLYKIVNEDDYETLIFLKQFPPSTVIPDIIISPAVYPISRHTPIASVHFIGTDESRNDLVNFFNSTCSKKEEIINKYNAKFIISKTKIECQNLKEIYNLSNYIYKTQ